MSDAAPFLEVEWKSMSQHIAADYRRSVIGTRLVATVSALFAEVAELRAALNPEFQNAQPNLADLAQAKMAVELVELRAERDSLKAEVERLQDKDEECQPCNAFVPRDHLYGSHQCPECGGTREECGNCTRDHHRGGWESCPSSAARVGCRNVRCRKSVAAMVASLRAALGEASKDALALCYEIEKLQASEQQTAVIILASALRQKIESALAVKEDQHGNR